MDRALQTALVAMAKHNQEKEEEVGRSEGDVGGGEEVKWIQEFVSLALPGSRHQVSNVTCTCAY